ncbi:hypothetical protein D082_40340 (plasmid) [Synechocystis sp. PCC 6714]|nr:hypothetical protein D082_40340 [Synechocystis sp. PCC 6714]
MFHWGNYRWNFTRGLECPELLTVTDASFSQDSINNLLFNYHDLLRLCNG